MARYAIRRILRRTASVAGLLFLVAGLAAAAAKGTGILFPDWSKPTKGSYQEPAGEVGKKAPGNQPWSVTTISSSIMGKPVEGKTTTVVGEIIDMSCYLQV